MSPLMADDVIIDLEEFWPSRRLYAFDEFCR